MVKAGEVSPDSITMKISPLGIHKQDKGMRQENLIRCNLYRI